MTAQSDTLYEVTYFPEFPPTWSGALPFNLGDDDVLATRITAGPDNRNRAGFAALSDGNKLEAQPQFTNFSKSVDRNVNGVAVGGTDWGPANFNACRWTGPLNSRVLELLAAQDDRYSEATGVADSGRIVGWLRTGGVGTPEHGWYWEPGGQELRLLSNQVPIPQSRALAVSPNGSYVGGYTVSGAVNIPGYWDMTLSRTYISVSGWDMSRDGFVVAITDNPLGQEAPFLTGFAIGSSTSPAQAFAHDSNTGLTRFLPAGYGEPADMNNNRVIVGNGPMPWVWLGSDQPDGGAAIDFGAFVVPGTPVSGVVMSGVNNSTGENDTMQFGGARYTASSNSTFITTTSSIWTRREPATFVVKTGTFNFGQVTDARRPDATRLNIARSGGILPTPYKVIAEFTAQDVNTVPNELWLRTTARVNVGRGFQLNLQFWDYQSEAWVNGSVPTGDITTHYLTVDSRAPGDLARFVQNGQILARLQVAEVGPVTGVWSVDIEQANWMKR